jgi:aminoglycoside phosphotransferase (APT) family kinase protein
VHASKSDRRAGSEDDDLVPLRTRIEARLSSLAEAPVTVKNLEPLAGGACQDNFRVELSISSGPFVGERRMVLRSDAPRSLPGSIGRREELDVINAAVSRQVKTPEAHWLSEGLVRPGSWCYFLDFVEGTAIGRAIVKGAAQIEIGRALGTILAEELARIHSITPLTHPLLFPSRERRERTDPVGAALVELRKSIERLPSPRPALELAAVWLEKNRPEARVVTLVHGDFRTGNFMVTPGGLSGVLDWEFSHFGSPLEDLAWISVRDWRFGVLNKPIGGFCDRASFYDAYRRASGREVDRAAVHWWEVYGNARWAAGALHQGERYKSGEQRDLELIAIARRAVEMEWEALRLIEGGFRDAR